MLSRSFVLVRRCFEMSVKNQLRHKGYSLGVLIFAILVRLWIWLKLTQTLVGVVRNAQ